MLQDIPTPTLREARSCVLETERLTLRRPTLADVKADRATRQRPPHRGEHPPSAASLSAGPCHRIRPCVGGFAARDRVPDRKQSHADRRRRHRLAPARLPELGYWLGFEHWGQGFGTEAARAVIDFTFEEFDVEHLISGARVTNPSSRNILEKCGFQWSGVELHRFEALGSSTPVDCFRLSRSVWSSLKNWASSTRRDG